MRNKATSMNFALESRRITFANLYPKPYLANYSSEFFSFADIFPSSQHASFMISGWPVSMRLTNGAMI